MEQQNLYLPWPHHKLYSEEKYIKIYVLHLHLDILIVTLFWLYFTTQITIFQSCPDIFYVFLGWISSKQQIKCLAQIGYVTFPWYQDYDVWLYIFKNTVIMFMLF